MRVTLALFLVLFTLPLVADARLHVILDPYVGSVDPGSTLPRTIFVTNLGPDAAQNVVLTMTIPTGARFDVDAANGWSCTSTSPGLVCTIDALAAQTTSEVLGRLTFDASAAGQQLVMRLDLTASNGGTDFPFFVNVVVRNLYPVTTSADSGAGSLRDAITSMNDSCLRECGIRFDLPAGSVLEPLTPLPAITTRAPVYVGPGPMVELSGAKLTTGHGLVYRGGSLLWITGLTINRFPWNGIHVAHGHLVCESCFLGTDITGRQARGNRGRGLSADDPDTFVTIRNSVLSGNERSGLFVWSAREVRVDHSFIGASPEGLPVPNGSSGIFIQEGFLVVSESTISNNGDFGVAVANTAHAAVFANTMTGNGVQPIDYGLNGPTLHGGNVPDAPELIGATYDASTNRTIVTGRVAITRAGAYRNAIELQADGVAQRTQFNLIKAGLGIYDFTMKHEGDLRGKVVTVTNSRSYDEETGALEETSEVSNGVVVN